MAASKRNTRRRQAHSTSCRGRSELIPTQCLADAHDAIMQLPNTYGTFYGQKQTNAEYSSRKALVCLVVRKVNSQELQPGRRVPRCLHWTSQKASRRLETDVVEVQAQFVPQPATPNIMGPDRDRVEVYTPSDADVGRTVFVALRDGRVLTTTCRGIHARLEPPQATLTDCILTDLVTSEDCGACLADEQGRIWGLLRGRIADTYSVFTPLETVESMTSPA